MHRSQPSEELHRAVWGAGSLPAGEREVLDTQEEVEDIWPEEQVRTPADAIEVCPSGYVA